ncbi:DUF3192 domain-containing protein [Rheinheimera sp.]|uniref:DUF3192 domain-containing protein n=1 Tax=Rheinheimera sp. TaxID=1869214 RepID=UPI0027B99B38|nr:DUF3192 domain-containing protein [Rheinheimera sp.]
MNKRIWLILALAIPLYPLLTWLVLTFYQDDPSKMIWNDREAYNLKYISQLTAQSPLTQPQLIEKLGGPDITEAKKVGTDIYQLMYYRTKREISDGITTRQECTALLFKNHQLIALAEPAVTLYQQATADDA